MRIHNLEIQTHVLLFIWIYINHESSSVPPFHYFFFICDSFHARCSTRWWNITFCFSFLLTVAENSIIFKSCFWMETDTSNIFHNLFYKLIQIKIECNYNSVLLIMFYVFWFKQNVLVLRGVLFKQSNEIIF